MNTYRIYNMTGMLLGHLNAINSFCAAVEATALFGVPSVRVEFHSVVEA